MQDLEDQPRPVAFQCRPSAVDHRRLERLGVDLDDGRSRPGCGDVGVERRDGDVQTADALLEPLHQRVRRRNAISWSNVMSS